MAARAIGSVGAAVRTEREREREKQTDSRAGELSVAMSVGAAVEADRERQADSRTVCGHE
jgi:hypothetical protein